MLPEQALAGGRGTPWKPRLLFALPTLLFPALVVGFDPTAHVAIAAAIVVAPTLLVIADVWPGLLVCMAAEVGGTAWMMSSWRSDGVDLGLMVLVYGAGVAAVLNPARWSVVNLLFSLGVPLGWAVGDGYPRAPGWLIGMLFAWAGGLAVRKQMETEVRLRSAQDDLAAQAAAEERRRIAREVHDLVAHSLAVTMLHLTGARLALADGEVTEASNALAEAERLGRSSMSGIRRAVGLLADQSADPEWSPEPDERDIAPLVADYKRAGLDVQLAETGSPISCEPTTGLGIFRVVQESLANAVQHAPGSPVRVELDWADDALTVRVTNPIAAPVMPTRPGHGLVGMRERIEALGGQFAAGYTDGEWRVPACIKTVRTIEPEPA